MGLKKAGMRMPEVPVELPTLAGTMKQEIGFSIKPIISKEQLRLVFVNKIGLDVYGKTIYEFVFSNNDITKVTGEDWNNYPANGEPQPPNKKYIEDVGSIKTDKFELDVIQDSGFFGMCDAQDGIIALAWEINKSDNEDDINETDKRLIFHYGELESSVNDKLYSKDIQLESINNK